MLPHVLDSSGYHILDSGQGGTWPYRIFGPAFGRDALRRVLSPGCYHLLDLGQGGTWPYPILGPAFGTDVLPHVLDPERSPAQLLTGCAGCNTQSVLGVKGNGVVAKEELRTVHVQT